MRKRVIDGKEVDFTEVEPLQSDEKWNVYQMPNGDILKIKTVLMRVWLGGIKDNKGNPIYEFEASNVVRAIAGKE